VQVNTEENPRISSRFAVSGIPAFFILKGGKAVGKLQGARPPSELLKWFRTVAG
jgi:thioredoxin 2